MKLDVIFTAELLDYTYINIVRCCAIFPVKIRVPDNFVMEVELVLENFRPVTVNSGNLDSLDRWECFCIHRFGASSSLSSGYIDLDLYVRIDLINMNLKYPSKRALEALIEDSLKDPIYNLELLELGYIKSGEYLKSIGPRLKGKSELSGVEVDVSLLKGWNLDENVKKFLSYVVDGES